MLNLLAKKSRLKRDGPSKTEYLKYGKLKKDNLTPNSFSYVINFKSDKFCDIKFLKLNNIINSEFNVIETNFINNNGSNYIHYVIEIGKYKFYDDLEILKYNNNIFFRSASRVGIYDMGVNENRVNYLLDKLI